MKQVRFEESEVPYQTLARFGLTQEKIEDLPMWALEDIGQGRRSPLLPIQVNNDEGETLKSRTRFALVRMEDGKVDVVFYPQLEKSPLEAFTQEQQEDLLAGKAILADVKDADGIRINQGDSQKWKENTKREWDKYTFGCYGCWVMGDDGNLDYVPEEEYTEELWNEQKKNGERNRASFSMHK